MPDTFSAARQASNPAAAAILAPLWNDLIRLVDDRLEARLRSAGVMDKAIDGHYVRALGYAFNLLIPVGPDAVIVAGLQPPVTFQGLRSRIISWRLLGDGTVGSLSVDVMGGTWQQFVDTGTVPTLFSAAMAGVRGLGGPEDPLTWPNPILDYGDVVRINVQSASETFVYATVELGLERL